MQGGFGWRGFGLHGFAGRGFGGQCAIAMLSMGWLLVCQSIGSAQRWEWTKLAEFPNTAGVASPFAGVAGHTLLVAGGANFPNKKPWEGGLKVWHDDVYALESPTSQWRKIGVLKRPVAYGVSATWEQGILCAGGSDDRGHLDEVFRIRIDNSELRIDALPSLPVRLANACGAIVDDLLILSGGLQQPDAPECENRTWALDLAALDASNDAKVLAWRELAVMPGRPRMLATAASHQGCLWVLGGVSLVRGPDGKPMRQYLKDCWKFQPDRETRIGRWTRQADLPQALAASPGPALVVDDSLWVFGGDDGSQVGVAPSEHRGFSKKLFEFDTVAGRWKIETAQASEAQASRVTVPLVPWSDGWVIPSGEFKPGIRSADVWFIRK
jgi:N-acetylneuraminic acid mutarotase